MEYYKLFGSIKKDEKIIENFLNKKRKKELDTKEKELIKNESIIYTDKCIQTDEFEGNDNTLKNKLDNINNININISPKKNNEIISNRKCDWNISKIKYFLSQNNSENKLTKRNKENKIEKINSNKIPKNRKNNFEKGRNKSKSIEKRENYKFNSSFESSRLKIDNKQKIDNKKTLNNNNILITRKNTINNSKIKEMQIFPMNFSSLKRFKKINKENINKKVEEEKKEKKRYYTINNSKTKTDRNSYHSERNRENSNKKKYISRIYSEKRIKISFGIIKEINFVNNL